TDTARVRGFLVVGVTAIALGWVWSLVLPLSKPLWTSSYVCVVSGLAMLAFAFTYVVVDIGALRSWAQPFLWLGVNPLAVYFLSEVVGNLLDDSWISRGSRVAPKEWLFWRVLDPALRPRPAEWASLVFGLAFVAVWIAVAGMLYQRRIRIQV